MRIGISISRCLSLLAVGVLVSLCPRAASAQCPSTKLLARHNQSYGDSLSARPIAMSHGVLIMGSPGDMSFGSNPSGQLSGSVTIQRYNGWGWEQPVTIPPVNIDLESQFGFAVATDGHRVAVVASHVNDNGTVQAIIHVFREEGSTWSADGTVSVAVPQLQYFSLSISVAIQGDVLAVGASQDADHGVSSGAVYIFRYIDGQWNHPLKLSPNGTLANDLFGQSVALSGDRLLVGTPGWRLSYTGAAFVYRRQGQNWNYEATLSSAHPTPVDRFGNSVALERDKAIVGGNRFACVFRCSGTAWVQEARLLPTNGYYTDQFGIAVAISGDTAVVGAPWDNQLHEHTGAAYVYRSENGRWQPPTKVVPADGLANDYFGTSIAASDQLVVVGAVGTRFTYPILRAEAAYVYLSDQLDGPDCNHNFSCDSEDITTHKSNDCNANGVPDECDIASAHSQDCNANGIPDECEHTYAVDDGTVESAIGSNNSNMYVFVYLNHFMVRPSHEVIQAIGFIWWANPLALSTKLLVYSDPDGDGDPKDAVLLTAVDTMSVVTPTNQYVNISIPPTLVGPAGTSFFIAAAVTFHGPQVYPAGFDTSSPYHEQSWLLISEPDELNLENLAENRYPAKPIHEWGFKGNWTLRAMSTTGVDCSPLDDVTGDGHVNADDLLVVINAWGPCPNCNVTPCPADLNHDCAVNVDDLLAVINHWG